MRRARSIMPLLIATSALAGMLAGCGGDDQTASPATTATQATTVTSAQPAEPEPRPDPPTPDLPGIGAADAALIEGYLGWTELTAPPIAELRSLGSAHPGRKRIWASPDRGDLAAGGRRAFPYPRDTVIVKEGRSGDDIRLIAIMEKVRANDATTGGWRYAEYSRPDGSAPFTRVSLPESGCAGCHVNANTRQRTDWVFYSLPR